MSKNIIIQEGGVGKQMTADKLKTNLVGGGSCLWVPGDEVQLGTKTITENGTYNASSDGYYGYSQVDVRIPNVGTATGRDGDGDEAVAYADPDTGDLVTDKVPSTIDVITPPTNPYGIYTDGQSISTEGMVAKAYLASGEEYGIVPNAEVTLNPTTAVYDASTDTGASGRAESDLETNIDQPIVFVPANTIIEYFSNARYRQAKCTVDMILCKVGYIDALLVSDDNTYIFSSRYSRNYPIPETEPWLNAQGSLGSSYTYDGKTVYYNAESHGSTGSYMRGGDTVYNIIPDNKSAWTVIYGSREIIQAGSRQTINVSWPRPRDGKVLETTFEILVAPGYTPGDGE